MDTGIRGFPCGIPNLTFPWSSCIQDRETRRAWELSDHALAEALLVELGLPSKCEQENLGCISLSVKQAIITVLI